MSETHDHEPMKVEFTVTFEDLTTKTFNSADLNTHIGWAVCFQVDEDGQIIGDVACYPAHVIKKITKRFINE